ncbi:MAG: terminase [Patescibacteria group bacterium]|nr:terminase [Patescibacteria group bacterium]
MVTRSTTRSTPKRKKPDLTTDERKALFLQSLAETCQVSKSCDVAGVHRTMAYKWRQKDEAFAEGWLEAEQIGLTVMEDEAYRRAFVGTLKPVFYKGEKCGAVREYSDALTALLLKARAPAKYRDNSSINLQGNMLVGEMSDEELREEIAALIAAGYLSK